MTRTLLIALTFILTVLSASAQGKEPTDEMLKELQEFKIKYLIQEMDLPADRQTEFTKVYTQYDNERSALFRELMQRHRSIRHNNNPTDTEYMVAAEAMATAKAREGGLEQKYFNKFKTMLTPKQLYQLKRAEKKFERKLGEMHKKGGKQKK